MQFVVVSRRFGAFWFCLALFYCCFVFSFFLGRSRQPRRWRGELRTRIPPALLFLPLLPSWSRWYFRSQWQPELICVPLALGEPWKLTLGKVTPGSASRGLGWVPWSLHLLTAWPYCLFIGNWENSSPQPEPKANPPSGAQQSVGTQLLQGSCKRYILEQNVVHISCLSHIWCPSMSPEGCSMACHSIFQGLCQVPRKVFAQNT